MIGELDFVLRLILAAVAGLIVGFSRRHQPASLRTFALICLGAAAFTLIGLRLNWDAEAGSRMTAQIITGVGFLGLAVVWKDGMGDRPHGLTTAAGIWVVAGLGVLIGFGMSIEAAVMLLLSLLILYSKKTLEKARLEE